MQRFKNILLVGDERNLDPAVVNRVVWLAEANGAAITVVDVVDAAPGELARLFGTKPGRRVYDVEHEVLEFHRARLSDVATPIRATGLPTTELVLQGIPFIEIIRKVLRDGHDLVIKGVAEGAGRRLFASTDLHLLRKCPCPVWLMKRDSGRRYGRILAAVDPDPGDDQRDALNTMIMDLATSLTVVDGSALDVVNAWQLEGEDTMRHSGFLKIKPAEVEALVKEKRQRSASALRRLVLSYAAAGVDYHEHLLKGRAREIIPAFADRERAELIVMGTVGRTGVPGLIIGNTAEAILNQVMCSVLAVKPPGFETPVGVETPVPTA